MGAPKHALQNTEIEVLKDLRNIIAKEGNGRLCVGYQTVAVTDSAVVKLIVPEYAMSAVIDVESAGSTNTAAAVRYTLDNITNPVTGAGSVDGSPLGDYDTIEILSQTNLNALRVIAVDAANTKYLKIHYFA